MFLDRDTHVANYTAKAVTPATTNTSKHSTVNTAGLRQGEHVMPAAHHVAPCCQRHSHRPLPQAFTPLFSPLLFSKTEPHREVNTLEGCVAVCVSALHTPAGPAKHQAGT